jgi:DNA-binding SARP family transcriptional activator
MQKLRLHLLGSPQAEIDNHPADIQRRKVWALLIYLAVTNQPQRRDSLAALFWPEESQSKARAALTRHLSELRKAIGAEYVTADRETVTLSGNIWLDVHQFQQLSADCEQDDDDCLAGLETAVPFPTLLQHLNDSQEKLIAYFQQATQEDLAVETDSENWPTLLSRVSFFHWHETYHVGQLEILRQLAGTDDAIIK